MLDSKAYKEYYAVASGAEPPKAKIKYKKKVDESVTSPKSKTSSASKGTILKSKAKVTKHALKKQPTKKTKAKGLAVLSESKVLDEQQQKISGADEGTGTIPGVPMYLHTNMKAESDDQDDHNDDSDNERTESDSEDILDPNLIKEDQTEYEEEDVDKGVRTTSDDEFIFEEKLDNDETKDDEVLKEMYEDVNVNLEKYLASKMKEAINVVVQCPTNKLREEAKVENQDFLNQVDSTMKKIIKNQVKGQVSKIMPNIEMYVTEYLRAKVLVRSTNQPQKAYAVVASLSEFKLKTILIDKMEANKSINRPDNQKNLYKALVNSYNSDKDILSSYDRGRKRRKSGKVSVSSKDSRSKEKKSSSTSKDASQSQHKSSSKSVYVKELSHTVEESSMQQDQEFITEDNIEQPVDKEGTKADWFKKPERPLILDTDWNVYSRRRIIAVTRLKIKMYDYGHLEEIEVHRDDLQLHTYKEGDFKRLRLQDIKDMLLLLVQQKLTNLTIDERFDLNVALLMFTRRIVIQKRRKRLMHTDELHKFSDGTLNDVRSVLHDIATGIRME
nr:hypothetical protein [Tanacetum cinerariifolium]GEX80767.1 hypothetical protein [Tanacetum cinerariifolium]